jgi:Asp-tRNA(Asn)/Glu-tRNA(Gln) amidotransferase A subunit family amidase
MLPSRDPAGLNMPGIITRTVSDLELGLTVISGFQDRSVSRRENRKPYPIRAIWSSDLGYVECEREIAEVALAATRRLQKAGYVTLLNEKVELSDPWHLWQSRRMGGKGVGDEAGEANDRELDRVFSVADLLITPTTPNRPHTHAGPGAKMSVGFTIAFNVSGHPAISVPSGHTSDGLPTGLHMVARRKDEALLMDLARAMEEINPWRMPDLGVDRDAYPGRGL